MTTKTVTLSTPIKRGDDEIKEISLRQPATGELRGLDTFDILRMNINAHRTLVPRISKIEANEFDQLTPKDLTAVQQEVVSFFTE